MAVDALQLHGVGPPHSLRHSGAAEFVARGGPLESCRRRGRWSALSSVQRYTKTQVLVESRSRLDEHARARAEAFWKRPAAAWSAALAAGPRSSLATLQRKALQKAAMFEGAVENNHVVVDELPGGARPALLVDTEWRRRTNGYRSM